MIFVCLNQMILGRVKWFRMAALRELNPVTSQVDPALAVLRLTKSYVKRQKRFFALCDKRKALYSCLCYSCNAPARPRNAMIASSEMREEVLRRVKILIAQHMERKVR